MCDDDLFVARATIGAPWDHVRRRKRRHARRKTGARAREDTRAGHVLTTFAQRSRLPARPPRPGAGGNASTVSIMRFLMASSGRRPVAPPRLSIMCLA